MSRMKDYMMELEDMCVEAIQAGAVSDAEVHDYVQTHGRGAPLADVKFVLESLSK
jgi:hypothetical protein